MKKNQGRKKKQQQYKYVPVQSKQEQKYVPVKTEEQKHAFFPVIQRRDHRLAPRSYLQYLDDFYWKNNRKLTIETLFSWPNFPENKNSTMVFHHLWTEFGRETSKFQHLYYTFFKLTLENLDQINHASAFATILHQWAESKPYWGLLYFDWHAIQLALLYHLPSCNAHEISNICWALVKLGCSPAELLTHTELREQLLLSVRLNADKFTARGIATLFWTLLELGYSSNDFSDELGQKLLRAIHRNAAILNPRETIQIFWSLARLAYYSLREEDNPLKQALLTAIERNLHGFKQKDLSLLLWSLASLGFLKTDFYHSLKQKLLTAIEIAIETCNLHEHNIIVDFAWALSKFGYSLTHLPYSLQRNLLIDIEQKADAFHAQDVTKIFSSLVHLNCSKRKLLFTPSLQKKLLEALERNTPYFNPIESRSVLWSLSWLKTFPFSWTALEQLLFAIEGNLDYFTSKNVTTTCCSLARLGYLLATLPPAFLQKLWTAIARTAYDLKPKEMINLLGALIKLGGSKDNLPRPVEQKLLGAIEHCLTQFNEKNCLVLETSLHKLGYAFSLSPAVLEHNQGGYYSYWNERGRAKIQPPVVIISFSMS